MASKLDKYKDEIFSDLLAGLTYRAMADKYDCQLSTLYAWFNKSENKDAYASALKESSSFYADKAEVALLSAESDKVEIMRARELAQHYRWMASKRNPRQFGDKLELNQNANVNLNLSNVSDEKLNDFLKAAGFDADK